MAAINTLLCSSCSAQIIPLFRPPRGSDLIGRRALFHSPFMSIDNSAPAIPGLDGSPIILSSDTRPSESSGGSGQSISYASEKDSGGGLNLSFSSLANAPTWTKLALGAVAILAIPFFRKLLKTEGGLKNLEEMEKVVETIAETVEKITEDIAEVLPDGESKEEVLKLEKIASLVDKNAEAMKYFINKIDDEVEGNETESKTNEGTQPKANDSNGDNVKMEADHSHEKGAEIDDEVEGKETESKTNEGI